MFTGRWPHELSATADRPLDATYPTLAEFLSSHGYATGGFVANTHYCNAAYGLDRGFAHYEDFAENRAVSPVATLRSSELGKRLVRHASALAGIPDPYGPRKDAARIQRDALDWLAAHPGRPFFAFLNYFDAHDPYLLPAGASPRFGKGFDAASYAASLKTLHQLSKAKPTPQTAELPGHGGRAPRRLRRLHRLPRRATRPALRRAGRARAAREHAGDRHVRPRRALRRAPALRPRPEPVPAPGRRPARDRPPLGTSVEPRRPRAGEPARPAGHRRRPRRPGRGIPLPGQVPRPALGGRRRPDRPRARTRPSPRSTSPPRSPTTSRTPPPGAGR